MSRGKARRSNTRGHLTGAEQRITSKLDDLAEFEEFQADVLPKLRAAMKSGKTADDIAKLVSPLLMAKLASSALRSTNPAAELALMREILDRGLGKPGQKTEITAKFSNMSDDQLDAMLASELAQIKEDEKDVH